MEEILDPGSKSIISLLKDNQRYKFRVVGEPLKVSISNGTKTRRDWMILPLGDEFADVQPIKYGVVPWEAEGIIVATGGTKLSDGKLKWDSEKVDGQCFEADVNWVAQDASNPKNINDKTGKPYKNLILSKFKASTPF